VNSSAYLDSAVFANYITSKNPATIHDDHRTIATWSLRFWNIGNTINNDLLHIAPHKVKVKKHRNLAGT
jgi:hypothetical protein